MQDPNDGRDDGTWLDSLEDARDALYVVLKQTEPGTGRRLHDAYSELKHMIERDSAVLPTETHDPAPPVPPERLSDYYRARDWKNNVSLPTREQQVLEVLSHESLTVRALTARLDDEQGPDIDVGESAVRSIVTRLYSRKDLAREPERAKNGQTRYRYFRPMKLEGPIADLDRAFRGECA